MREPITRWYRGTVADMTQLRPHTVIRDEAMPMLLRTARRPTFVTINVGDFWRQMVPDRRFCVACCALSHTHALEVSVLLRRFFALDRSRTQQQRLGTIARLSVHQVQYSTSPAREIERLAWSKTR